MGGMIRSRRVTSAALNYKAGVNMKSSPVSRALSGTEMAP